MICREPRLPEELFWPWQERELIWTLLGSILRRVSPGYLPASSLHLLMRNGRRLNARSPGHRGGQRQSPIISLVLARCKRPSVSFRADRIET